MIQPNIFGDEGAVKTVKKRDKYFVKISVAKNKDVGDRITIHLSPDAVIEFGFEKDMRFVFGFDGSVVSIVNRDNYGCHLIGDHTLTVTTTLSKHDHPDWVKQEYTKIFDRSEIVYLPKFDQLLLNTELKGQNNGK